MSKRKQDTLPEDDAENESTNTTSPELAPKKTKLATLTQPAASHTLPSPLNLGPRQFPLSSSVDMSAVPKVFGVFELLESILRYLPFVDASLETRGAPADQFNDDIAGIPRWSQPQNLFRIQGVSKEFGNVIQTLSYMIIDSPDCESRCHRHGPDTVVHRTGASCNCWIRAVTLTSTGPGL